MEAVEKSQYRVAGCRDTLLTGGSRLVEKMVHWAALQEPLCLLNKKQPVQMLCGLQGVEE